MPSTACWSWDARVTSASPDPDVVGIVAPTPLIRAPRQKAFLVELVEDQTVVCDLTNERTHGRRVGWCYRQGQDIAEAVIAAGFARDCPRYSGGRYADVEPPQAADLPFPGYCRLR